VSACFHPSAARDSGLAPLSDAYLPPVKAAEFYPEPRTCSKSRFSEERPDPAKAEVWPGQGTARADRAGGRFPDAVITRSEEKLCEPY